MSSKSWEGWGVGVLQSNTIRIELKRKDCNRV